jgi:hypothetical protein
MILFANGLKFRAAKVKLILWIFIFIFFGCKKPEQNATPVISITTPIENNFFSVGDFIGITGKVTDDGEIEYVQINLLDQNFIPVLDASTFYPKSKEFIINYAKEIYDESLLSGIYYLNIKASDGENDKNFFLKINLIELPLQLKKVFSFNSNGIDSIGNSIVYPFYSFTDDFNNAVVGNYNNQLVFCGEYSGDLICLTGESFSQSWLVENQGAFGSPYFTSLANDEVGKKYLVGLANGFINTYNKNGLLTNQFSIPENYIAEKIFLAGDKILVQQVPQGFGSKMLSIYFKSGSFNASQTIEGDILEVSKVDDENYLVFIQETDKLRIYNFNVESNFLTFYFDDFEEGIVNDVEVIDGYTFFLSHQDKIYRYVYGGSGASIFKQGEGYKLLRHEKLSNTIYSSIGNNIEIFDPYSNGNILGTINAGEIVELLFLYNR